MRERFRRWLGIFAVVPRFMAAKRAAELHLAETKTIAEPVRGTGEFFQFCPALRVEQIELFSAVSKATEANSEQPDFSFHISMGAKEFLKHGKNFGIEPRGFSQRFGARMRFESGVPDRQRERSRGEARFAESFAGFLRKMAEHRRHRVRIVGVLAKGVVVGDGFRLRVDGEFGGIAAGRLAVEGWAPLAKNIFQLFLRNGGDLLDRFNSQGPQRPLCDFPDAGNFANRQWRKKPFFAAGRNPDQTARLGLVRRDFRDEPRRGESAGTR